MRVSVAASVSLFSFSCLAIACRGVPGGLVPRAAAVSRSFMSLLFDRLLFCVIVVWWRNLSE